MGPILTRNNLRRKMPGTSSESIGGDRLRKAIEKNRRKQAQRESLKTTTGIRTAPKPLSQRSNTPIRNRITSRAMGGTRAKLPGALNSNSDLRRVSVGTVGQTRMASSRSQSSIGRSPSMVSYGESKGGVKDKIFKYVYYFLWLFCLFLLLRLFFAERGVVEYYNQQSRLMDKVNLQQSIIDSNKNLVAEIKKIKTNNAYQKKIVREQLGLIASNEFLILFSEDGQDFSN